MGLVDPRVSYWVPDPDEPAQLRDLTVGGLLDEAAAEVPDREAIVFSAYDDVGISVRWTYAELRDRARRVAGALMASGIEKGDRIGVWATNLPEWMELEFGAAYAGAILVPLNPLYRAREVQFVLAKSGAKLCFVLPENRGVSLWDVLADVTGELPALEARIAIGDAPDDGGPGWETWLRRGDAVRAEQIDERAASVRPDDSAQIQFTSGTTGFPKGAELPHQSIVNDGRLFSERAGMVEGGRHVNPMPYFHCGGCVMSTLGAVAVRGTQLPIVTFEPDRVVRTIDTEQATSVSLVPTMMIAVEEALERIGGSLASLEVVVTGGSPVPVELERRWVERFGTAFAITYGMTEASPVITMTGPDDPEDLQLSTCGKPLPHVEVDIVEPGTETRVPLGEQGELRTRGWLVMKGYWDNPEATEAAISTDGFLRSGDLARMDADGYVSITGRAKEMIIRGGENIYPAEIENALRELPAVVDAAVVGVPSERYGEECAAFVRLAEGASLDHATMSEQLRDQVARFKIPRHLEVVDEFPLTPSGKVQKFKLREQFDALPH